MARDNEAKGKKTIIELPDYYKPGFFVLMQRGLLTSRVVVTNWLPVGVSFCQGDAEEPLVVSGSLDDYPFRFVNDNTHGFVIRHLE